MDRIAQFLADNTPDWWILATGGPLLIAWSLLCLWFAGWLKARRGWRTGYSRKTFHFLTFATATVITYADGLGLPITCLFGGMTSLVVLLAIILGDDNPLYEAIAREKDAPHRTWYIVVPYVATLLGGLTLAIFFPRTAAVGLLACGIGDAVGEPVGVRFGRHRYRVPMPGKVASHRTVEGSIGVLLASTLAAWLGALTVADLEMTMPVLGSLLLLGIVSALVEAVSPHGWDNAVMMIIPAALAELLW